MGCWNHTCALSNLPVMYRDEVYVFLLLKNELRDNLVHPSSFWLPFPLFFEGKYNDYGAVEDCHGPMLDTIVGIFKKYLFEMEEGENKFHDIPVKKDKFDVELLFDADGEERLFLTAPSYYSQLRERNIDRIEVKHIVIRKNILDSILKSYKSEHFRYCNFTFEKLHEMVKVIFTKAIESRNEKKFLVDGKFDHFYETIRFMGPVIFEFDVIDEILETSDQAKIDALIYQMTVFDFMNNFMNFNRRVWTPTTSGAGQEVSTESHKLLAKIITAEAKRIDKSFDC